MYQSQHLVAKTLGRNIELLRSKSSHSSHSSQGQRAVIHGKLLKPEQLKTAALCSKAKLVKSQKKKLRYDPRLVYPGPVYIEEKVVFGKVLQTESKPVSLI